MNLFNVWMDNPSIKVTFFYFLCAITDVFQLIISKNYTRNVIHFYEIISAFVSISQNWKRI